MTVDINEVPEFYRTYVRHVEGEPIVAALERSRDELIYLVNTFSDEKASFRYAEGKWSVKDLLQHLIDAERVFTYRAMRFSRNDATELSGFDQDPYAYHAQADKRDLKELVNELVTIRSSSILLFKSLSEEELKRTGVASGHEMSAGVLGFITAGHMLHHLKVIREKYL